MSSLLLRIRLFYGILLDIYVCFRLAALPILRAIKEEPSLILRPRELSRLYMNFVWIPYGDGVDESAREEKTKLVTPWASGVVFEIGAGHGHLVKYLDRTRVTAYIALEPNVNMHERLRTKAREFGFEESEGSFLVVPFGVEDVERVVGLLRVWDRRWGRSGGWDGSASASASANGNEGSEGRVVDTIVSILSLCSIPAQPSLHISDSGESPSSIGRVSTPPADTIRALQTRILRPGGQLLFYEHVRSPIPAFSRAQDVLAPIWRIFFDGCVIGVDSVRAVWEAGFEEADFIFASGSESGEGEGKDVKWDWKRGYDEWVAEGEVRVWNRGDRGDGWREMYTWGKKGEAPESLFFHQSGRCVKR